MGGCLALQAPLHELKLVDRSAHIGNLGKIRSVLVTAGSCANLVLCSTCPSPACVAQSLTAKHRVCGGRSQGGIAAHRGHERRQPGPLVGQHLLPRRVGVAPRAVLDQHCRQLCLRRGARVAQRRPDGRRALLHELVCGGVQRSSHCRVATMEHVSGMSFGLRKCYAGHGPDTAGCMTHQKPCNQFVRQARSR